MTVANQAIINDFQIFLDYINKDKGIVLTKTKQVLRNPDLMYLNEQLHFKSPGVHRRSPQLAFSLLSAFFYIAKVSELASVKQEKSKYLLVANATKIAAFQEWTKTEQYFFILESFWCYLNWEKAFDTRAFWDKDFYKKLAKRKADKWVTVGDINLKRKGKIQAPSYVQFTEVFAALGWIGLIWDDNLEKRPSSYHFPYKSACITELGKAMLAKLFEARSKFDWHGLDPYYNPDIIRKIVVVRKRQAEETKAMGMQSFLSYERDWDNIEIPDEPEEKFADAFLSLLSTTEPIRSWYPIKRPFVQGQYKFKVALDKD
ncbi:MAG: hypothetical protein AAF806_12085, partial [Bacteroidota bacterium]